MTERERWTVYPLLVLSLAVSLRDKLVRPTLSEVPQLRCRQLDVVGADGRSRMTLGLASNQAGALEVHGSDGRQRIILGTGTNGGGLLEVLGNDHNVVLALSSDAKTQSGVITSFVGDRIPQVHLGSLHEHGVVTTLGPDQQKRAELGVGTSWAGVFTPTEKQPDGEPQSIAGQLTLFSSEGKPQFLITHDDQGQGRAMAVDAQGNLYLLLAARVQLGQRQNAPEEAPAAPGERPPAAGEPAAEPPEATKTPAQPVPAAPDESLQPPPQSDASSGAAQRARAASGL